MIGSFNSPITTPTISETKLIPIAIPNSLGLCERKTVNKNKKNADWANVNKITHLALLVKSPAILPNTADKTPGIVDAMDAIVTHKDGWLLDFARISNIILKRLIPSTWKKVLPSSPKTALFFKIWIINNSPYLDIDIYKNENTMSL